MRAFGDEREEPHRNPRRRGIRDDARVERTFSRDTQPPSMRRLGGGAFCDDRILFYIFVVSKSNILYKCSLRVRVATRQNPFSTRSGDSSFVNVESATRTILISPTSYSTQPTGQAVGDGTESGRNTPEWRETRESTFTTRPDSLDSFDAPSATYLL